MTSTKPKAVDWKWKLLECLAQNAFEIFLLFKLSSSQNYSAYVRYRYQRLSKNINILHLGDWVFLKEKQKKPCCHFVSNQWMWSLDVWSNISRLLLHSLVFFLPLLHCQLKGIDWKMSHPSKLTCFYFSKYYYCRFCYVIS